MGSIKIQTMRKLYLTIIISLYAATYAHATWSIIAVDRKTGEVGIAGASCTYNVHGIGDVIPGKGVIVVQACSNKDAREHGARLIDEGATSSEIIEALRDKRFDPENQQYGIVLLNDGEPAATYSGDQISNCKEVKTGKEVAVLGNCLANKDMIDKAYSAFYKGRKKKLAERLVAALSTGAYTGGDKRCGKQRASSAFVTVYKKGNNKKNPYLDIVVYGLDKHGNSAVAILEKEFNKWRKQSMNRRSTEIHIMP